MVTIDIKVYTNCDDAFVAWAPSAFIPGCRGFRLDRQRSTNAKPEIVENRVGLKKDHPKPREHRPSNEWPFQRFNWTDHVVDIGNKVRYRVTSMVDDGSGRPYKEGPASGWTDWATLSSDAGGGFSCFFNRGIVLSQFVASYLASHKLTPAKFKAQLKKSADPKFRKFLQGDLGDALFGKLAEAKKKGLTLHAALYELGDTEIEKAMIALKGKLNVILTNGSEKGGDGNKESRKHVNAGGIQTINRLLGYKGLGHNKFLVFSKGKSPTAVWTGSTNWSTTGLCTQMNNALFIEDKNIAKLFRQQWDLLKDSSPPKLKPAAFSSTLMSSNDRVKKLSIGGADVTVQFTRTSNGSDMKLLGDLITQEAKQAVLFLMFTPGKQGLHTLAAQRATEPGMYVRGVVSTLGNQKGDSAKNVLDIKLVSDHQTFKPDRYTVVQPQGVEVNLSEFIKEVTRRDFLAQIGHAIVHSKVLILDPFSDHPIVVTGSHNFSAPASKANDENLVIVRGHKKLAEYYAVNIMSVYQHYRYGSYVREMLKQHKQPWSNLEDDDKWLQRELKSKAFEINLWA
jgi:phosphatidylserine/phosphatidylglycerophosphate/cardiolipin synthase-like enzyme